MSKGLIYLAGPMSNIPYFNFAEFFEYERQLQAEGWEVFSPAQEDIKRYGEFYLKCPNGSHLEMDLACFPHKPPSYRDCLRVDLNFIMDKAGAIALMPGWWKSRGAVIEKLLAEVIGLEVIYLK